MCIISFHSHKRPSLGHWEFCIHLTDENIEALGEVRNLLSHRYIAQHREYSQYFITVNRI